MVYINKYPKTINYCFEVLNVFTWICCGKILLTFIYSELERSEASPGGARPHWDSARSSFNIHTCIGRVLQLPRMWYLMLPPSLNHHKISLTLTFSSWLSFWLTWSELDTSVAHPGAHSAQHWEIQTAMVNKIQRLQTMNAMVVSQRVKFEFVSWRESDPRQIHQSKISSCHGMLNMPQ